MANYRIRDSIRGNHSGTIMGVRWSRSPYDMTIVIEDRGYYRKIDIETWHHMIEDEQRMGHVFADFKHYVDTQEGKKLMSTIPQLGANNDSMAMYQETPWNIVDPPSYVLPPRGRPTPKVENPCLNRKLLLV